MPELTNARYEAFCRGLASLGMTGADAVRHARFETGNPRQRAHRLLARDEIKARIAELEAERAAREAQMAAAVAPDDAAHEPGSLEWLLAEHQRNLLISKARTDTKEARATLIEIGRLKQHYVDRVETTVKADPLTVMSAREIEALRGWIAARLSAPTGPEPRVIDVEPDAPDA